MKRLLTLALAFFAATGVAAMAAEDLGKQEYMVACAVCHGESGLGAGPMAEVMNLAVPGLTTLAQKNDGEFPFLKTLMVIDGRTGVRGHGGPMPVWGDRFETTALETYGEYGAEAVARGRLLSLVYYIESIQQ